MKHLLLAATLVAVITSMTLAADVGIPINTGQPGFYGPINIGGYPLPQLIYQQPVVINQMSSGRQPIYLHVPPGHAKNWRKHCQQYNACGENVYFVRDNWYKNQYVPHYQESIRNEHAGDSGGKHKNNGHGKDKGH